MAPRKIRAKAVPGIDEDTEHRIAIFLKGYDSHPRNANRWLKIQSGLEHLDTDMWDEFAYRQGQVTDKEVQVFNDAWTQVQKSPHQPGESVRAGLDAVDAFRDAKNRATREFLENNPTLSSGDQFVVIPAGSADATDDFVLQLDNPFERALAEMVKTHRSKTADYTHGQDEYSAFAGVAANMGIPGLGTKEAIDFLIRVKAERIKALRVNGSTENPTNESVLDTYKDQAVYAAILFTYAMEEQELALQLGEQLPE